MTDIRDRATELVAAVADAEERFTARNPLSRQRFEEARQVMPGGNTRTSLYYSPFPVTFAGGEGQRLTDLDGHTYVDLLGEYSAGLYGHSHPAVVGAVREALGDGIALGGPNRHDVELATLVTERFPSMELVRFTNSGTEANLMALSVARVVTGRTHVLVFDGGYHGSVFSFRGAAPLNAPFPFLVSRYNDLPAAEKLIRDNRDQLAAVLVEPMLGGAGAIPGTAEFLQGLAAAAREAGALFILDEVMTSRLGSGGGLQEVHELHPDITTLGKYVGGGLSFGAFGGTRDIMARFDPHSPGSLSHPGTFNNNTLTMAAGTAGLQHVYTREAAAAHNARGDWLRDRLNALFAESRLSMQATGIGSLIGLHFQSEPISTPDDIRPAEAAKTLLHLELMARGFYFARRGYLALSVALEQADLDAFLDAVGDFLDEHRAALQS